MNLKKIVIASAAAALLVGSTINASAAELTPANYVNVLKENNQENLIINVEAYKAAYSDLAEAFGDDSDAYIQHYLTIGVYEGRTKGVLFDPLVYAEAYSDVKEAFGYNIPAIVNHYLTFGISENRTQGTAVGYADLAEAERAGAQKTNIQRNVILMSDSDSSAAGSSHGSNAASNNNAAAGMGSNVIINGNNTVVDGSTIVNAANGAADNGNTLLNNSNSTTAGIGSNPVNSNNTVSNSSTAAGNSNATASNNTTASDSTASSSSNNTSSSQDYHHTTSIYANDDSTLLRVEYYDDQNKLFQYSSVTNYDGNTNSYTEDIYHYDEESETEIHDRTDTYVNGVLSSSETH